MRFGRTVQTTRFECLKNVVPVLFDLDLGGKR